MKKLLLSFILTISATFIFCNSENINTLSNPAYALLNEIDDPIDAVKKAVIQHLEGSAARDVAKMKSVLHENFRIVVNDMKKGPFILDRESMFSMYEQGKFGGEVKPIEIVSIDVQGNLTAIVKVREIGKKAIFNLYFSLIQFDGKWMIINELAYLEYLQ